MRSRMLRKFLAPLFLITLSSLVIGIPLFAHHGTAGVYDYTHRITTKAIVMEYLFANPHVQIYFTLKNWKHAREWLDEEDIQAW